MSRRRKNLWSRNKDLNTRRSNDVPRGGFTAWDPSIPRMPAEAPTTKISDALLGPAGDPLGEISREALFETIRILGISLAEQQRHVRELREQLASTAQPSFDKIWDAHMAFYRCNECDWD